MTYFLTDGYVFGIYILYPNTQSFVKHTSIGLPADTTMFAASRLASFNSSNGDHLIVVTRPSLSKLQIFGFYSNLTQYSSSNSDIQSKFS